MFWTSPSFLFCLLPYRLFVASSGGHASSLVLDPSCDHSEAVQIGLFVWMFLFLLVSDCHVNISFIFCKFNCVCCVHFYISYLCFFLLSFFFSYSPGRWGIPPSTLINLSLVTFGLSIKFGNFLTFFFCFLFKNLLLKYQTKYFLLSVLKIKT